MTKGVWRRCRALIKLREGRAGRGRGGGATSSSSPWTSSASTRSARTASIARTPVIDALARAGVGYRRAHVHNVVCMPSRSTMLTGQYPRTHGVIANGISLPADAPSVAMHLRRAAGYRTALVGKAHFEPHLDPLLVHRENNLAAGGSTGPWRGFEHVELRRTGQSAGTTTRRGSGARTPRTCRASRAS